MSSRAMSGAGPILTKILVTAVTGGLAFVITDLADQPLIWTLTMSVFIGGVTLVVQFLIDLAQQLKDSTELSSLAVRSALRSDSVTQLVRNALMVGAGADPVVRSFAQHEIDRLSQFLKDFSGGEEVSSEGDDPNWLLGLTRSVQRTIDATSLTSSDARGRGFVDEQFWNSDLAELYLDVQEDAIKRGVVIRRLFILHGPESADDFLTEICRAQRSRGIAVAILDASKLRGSIRYDDFILFDKVISYEFSQATSLGDNSPAEVVKTSLVRRSQWVARRNQRFQYLWSQAREFEPHPA